jgi:PhnB protein
VTGPPRQRLIRALGTCLAGEVASELSTRRRPAWQTWTPHIVVRDAGRAAEWYERALGAEIGSRIPVPDGRLMQIELLFGDSPVMVADEFPEWGAVSPLTLGGTYGALTITTDAVDELWERALAAGAQVHSPLQDAFWGERHGQIIDPFGHRWGLAQHLEDVPQDEIVRRAAELFGAAS